MTGRTGAPWLSWSRLGSLVGACALAAGLVPVGALAGRPPAPPVAAPQSAPAAPAEPVAVEQPPAPSEPAAQQPVPLGAGYGGLLVIVVGTLGGALAGGYWGRRRGKRSEPPVQQQEWAARLGALEQKVRGLLAAPQGSAGAAPADQQQAEALPVVDDLQRRVQALEAFRGDPGLLGNLGRGPIAPPAALSLANPGMGPQESALLAVVNDAWERGPVNRADLLSRAEDIALQARFFALRNIDKTLQTLWDDVVTFLPSEDEGGWLLCDEPDGSVRVLPADPSFFRFTGVMTLVRRMFEGVPAPVPGTGSPPDPRFVRAYRAARLRQIDPGRYKLIERGHLLLGGGAEPQLKRPMVWDALRRAAGPGRRAAGQAAAPGTLTDVLGGMQARLLELERDVGELQRGLPPGGEGQRQGPPAGAPAALSDQDLARLAVFVARLAAKDRH